MRGYWVVLGASLLTSCSPPVMFAVDVDEPISGGALILNGNSAGLMKNIDGAYWAKWSGSDASGSIVVRYPDGAKTTCSVGYVTHGMSDIQRFEIKKRICEQLESND